ncbi:unnamed protein product [marine sediment metagenome]|uniref:Uncharacterized protein n=1 Tax=marine sediment metagenome TaxID=412755 RepID=X0YT08_9ZZZZ
MVKSPTRSSYSYESPFQKMHMYEIKDRATIFYDLNYPKSEAKKRIKQNIEWEFDFFPMPDFYKEVDKIVDFVYGEPKKGS